MGSGSSRSGGKVYGRDRDGGSGRGAPKRSNDRAARPGRLGRDSQPEREITPPKQWGGVARRGTRSLRDPDDTSASATWRKAMSAAAEVQRPQRAPDPETDEVWVRDRTGAPALPEGAAPSPRRREKSLPPALKDELDKAAGRKESAKLHDRLEAAARAYDHDRYQEARRYLKPLADEAPSAPAVRELFGLTLYRLGFWTAAIKELEAFHALSASFDQHPVLADCHRARRQFKRAEEVWEELRRASPGAELVAEGRIVAAGARADQGDLTGAIELFGKARADVRNPRDHHMRQWYALADLLERSGDIPQARELFGRIARHDPTFFDAATRARALR